MPGSVLKEATSSSNAKSDGLKRRDLPVFPKQEPSETVTEFFASLHPFFSRLIIYIILAFVIVALVWMGVGKIDVVSSAQFKIVPLGNMVTSQAPRMGVIEGINVKEGDLVEEGDILFKLHSRESLKDIKELEQAKMLFRIAEYNLLEVWPQKLKLAQEQNATSESRLKLAQKMLQIHKKALRSYRDGQSQNSDEIQDVEGLSDSDINVEIYLRTVELQNLKRKYQQSQKLYDRKLISLTDLQDAEVRYLSALASQPSRLSEIERQTLAIQDQKRQILEARIELEREEIRIQYNYDDALKRLNRAQKALDRNLEGEVALVLAPKQGIVTQVTVNTVGQIVNNGEVLAVLAPDSVPMVAELSILNKDVGLIKPGQVIRLKYDAFEFQDYGIRKGWLTQIAPNATIHQSLGPIFRGIVQLEETQIMVRGQAIPLKYGMSGVAEMVTDRVSLLMFILKPLRQLYESATFNAQQNGSK